MIGGPLVFIQSSIIREKVYSMRRTQNFIFELTKMPGGERISACLTCLSCTASCPINKINERFNPHRIIRMIFLGLVEDVLKMDFIWLCANCDACRESCPRDVRIPDFMALLRNEAVKEGHIPAGVKAQMKTIRENGKIYVIDEFDNKKRGKLSLPSLPTSCEVMEKLLSEE